MTPRTKEPQRRRHAAIPVHQWLEAWSEVSFDERDFRSKPPKVFHLFSLPAGDLRALSGIFRRSTDDGVARALDLGIQRRHNQERSDEIREYVRHGFPWSSLSKQRRESGEFDDLKKPGWLPTAIVVNILRPGDSRRGKNVHAKDAITIEDSGAISEVVLPAGFDDHSWQPAGLPPVEVIDGQHRLWAFEDRAFANDYSLPVVAFWGLDISWQAYLFYTINIKPKKINASLAYDLYPLLRSENWLEKFAGHSVYRETRAQEITEALWSYPQSPWHERIDMLGGSPTKLVTQAAWIRNLQATFVKAFESRRAKIGGLFGAPMGEHLPVLGWSRAQQSAFIILIWQELSAAIQGSDADWITAIGGPDEEGGSRAAFVGRFSLLNSDQGVRGVLAVANDLCWLRADKLGLEDIESDDVGDGTSETAIASAIDVFHDQPVGDFIRDIAQGLASYDWRTSGDPGLSEQERSTKARFRGGTGYRELRIDLLRHLAGSTGGVGEVASEALEELAP